MDNKINGPVLKGKISNKSKSTSILGSLIAGDVQDLSHYIVEHVIKPKVKELIVDSVKTYVYGAGTKPSSGSSLSTVSYRSYDGYSQGSSYGNYGYVRQTEPRREKSLNEFPFQYEEDADAMLKACLDYLSANGALPAIQIYSWLRENGIKVEVPYPANYYGWRDLSSAKIYCDETGDYILKLPRPEMIR